MLIYVFESTQLFRPEVTTLFCFVLTFLVKLKEILRCFCFCLLVKSCLQLPATSQRFCVSIHKHKEHNKILPMRVYSCHLSLSLFVCPSVYIQGIRKSTTVARAAVCFYSFPQFFILMLATDK